MGSASADGTTIVAGETPGRWGRPQAGSVEAENPPTVTARSTVGAGTLFFGSSEGGVRKVLLQPSSAGTADRGMREPGPIYDITSVVVCILQVVEQTEG